jgi:hypothetical protein
MPPRPSRWPGVLDWIILASVTFAAIGASRIDSRVVESRLAIPPSHSGYASLKPLGQVPEPERTKRVLREAFYNNMSVLVLITPGLALAMFRDRSMFRRGSVRGVGVLSTAIAGPMIVVYLLNDLLLRRLSESIGGYGNNPLSGIWGEVAEQVSVAILAFWVVLALGRRWHAEPHWRDRLGRALGFAWFGYLIVHHVVAPLWLYA